MPPTRSAVRHDIKALEIFPDDLRQQKCRDGRDDEGEEREAERMGEHVAVAAFALGKSAEKFRDARAKVERDGEDRPELDDDGIHFPKAILQVDAEQLPRRCADARWS